MSNLCRARLNTCSHGNRNPAMRQRAAVTMRAAAEQTMTVSAKMAQLRADGRTAMIPFICAGAALSDDCANSNHEQPLRQKNPYHRSEQRHPQRAESPPHRSIDGTAMRH